MGEEGGACEHKTSHVCAASCREAHTGVTQVKSEHHPNGPQELREYYLMYRGHFGAQELKPLRKKWDKLLRRKQGSGFLVPQNGSCVLGTVPAVENRQHEQLFLSNLASKFDVDGVISFKCR